MEKALDAELALARLTRRSMFILVGVDVLAARDRSERSEKGRKHAVTKGKPRKEA